MISTHYLLAGVGQRACSCSRISLRPTLAATFAPTSTSTPTPRLTPGLAIALRTRTRIRHASHSASPPPPLNQTKPKSPHATFYTDTLPAMIPVFLLGSAVFLALQLTQLNLSHAKFMEEASAQIAQLEAEIEALQAKRASALNPSSPGGASEIKTSSQSSSTWRWW